MVASFIKNSNYSFASADGCYTFNFSAGNPKIPTATIINVLDRPIVSFNYKLTNVIAFGNKVLDPFFIIFIQAFVIDFNVFSSFAEDGVFIAVFNFAKGCVFTAFTFFPNMVTGFI